MKIIQKIAKKLSNTKLKNQLFKIFGYDDERTSFNEFLNKLDNPKFNENFRADDFKKFIIDSSKWFNEDTTAATILQKAETYDVLPEVGKRGKKEKGQISKGRTNNNDGKGLYDYEIEEIMKPYKNFAGVISSDEVNKLPLKNEMGFVMNLDPRDKPGSHWVSCYIDIDNDKSIEYYDSYAREPSNDFLIQIKKLVDDLNPDTYLKFKVNKIVEQMANSDTCGFHACNFLINRFNGVPFKDCTGFSDIKKAEKNIDKLKEKYEDFGFI